jgi:serine/threonine-protein kinase
VTATKHWRQLRVIDPEARTNLHSTIIASVFNRQSKIGNPMNPTQIGDFAIIEKLGSGGMGSVYLGRHVTSGQVVAVKVLPASLAREEGFAERFAREVEAMRKLKNRHIVQLYESGQDGDTSYYAMEYVSGETLMSILRREKRLPWRQAVDIAIQICSALKAAHDAGVIHRDLKPSNLLIAVDGTVKLTDFGVAQLFATQRLTVTGGVVGTAEFMSPEQAEGKRATKQSDLYSLGAVLYAMVAGHTPFSGQTAVEVMQKHRFGRFDRPRMFVPEIPTWLDDVICQLLEKDPGRRFPDAFVLARRLQQVVSKVDYIEDRTTADGGIVVHLSDETDSPTQVAGGAQGPSTGPGPATAMKHLVRSQLESDQQQSVVGAFFNQTWVLVTLLVLLVIGGFWWFRGKGTADGDDGLGDVATANTEAGRLLSLARRRIKEDDLAAAEQIAFHLRTLIADDPSRAELLSQTNRLLERISARRDRQREATVDWLRERLNHASKLNDDGRVADANAIWRAIVDLYADRSDAADAVRQAREALRDSTKPLETSAKEN